MYIKNNRGIALILIYLFITILVIMLSTFFYTLIQSMKISQRHSDFIKAFYAAESAIDVGLSNLPAPPPPIPFNGTPQNLGTPVNAQYETDIIFFGPTLKKWQINGIGYVPDSTTIPRWEVEIEVVAEKSFFSNALYSGSNLTIKSTTYTVNGDVFYDEDGILDIQHPGGIIGETTQGETVDFRDIDDGGDIDYDGLRAMAADQQLNDTHGFDHLIDVSDWGSSGPPDGFWYTRGDDGVDNDSDGTTDEYDEWVPNIIYVEGTGDLNIGGGITVGGFIVIVSGDCQITGTMTLEGCMLVIDDLKISGTIDATGGLWTGDLIPDDEGGNKDGIFVNGSINIVYNQDYMDAINSLGYDFTDTMAIISWQEIRRQVI